MDIVMRNVNDLKPYENNPRDNSEAVDFVATSIKNFGFKVPIIIDKNDVIVCGHTRLLAAKKLKIKKVPTILADDLTDEQIKAFRIADNKVAEQAIWDYDKLRIEMEGLNFDLHEFGFSDFELNMMEDVCPQEKSYKETFDAIDKTVYDETKTILETKPKKIKRVQCPCCGEFFEFKKSMVKFKD